VVNRRLDGMTNRLAGVLGSGESGSGGLSHKGEDTKEEQAQ
jgi:hypothetical protein